MCGGAHGDVPAHRRAREFDAALGELGAALRAMGFEEMEHMSSVLIRRFDAAHARTIDLHEFAALAAELARLPFDVELRLDAREVAQLAGFQKGPQPLPIFGGITHEVFLAEGRVVERVALIAEAAETQPEVALHVRNKEMLYPLPQEHHGAGDVLDRRRVRIRPLPGHLTTLARMA